MGHSEHVQCDGPGGRVSSSSIQSDESFPPLPPVSAQVDPGNLLLAVCVGDDGEHTIRAERAAQKPRGGPERGQLCAASPALARGQPGCAAA